jgi:hypothetical protein
MMYFHEFWRHFSALFLRTPRLIHKTRRLLLCARRALVKNVRDHYAVPPLARINFSADKSVKKYPSDKIHEALHAATKDFQYTHTFGEAVSFYPPPLGSARTAPRDGAELSESTPALAMFSVPSHDSTHKF